MGTVLIASGFGLVVALSGIGWAGRTKSGGAGPALASTACLAMLLVISTDIAALWRYTLWPVLLVAVLICLAGWVRSVTGNPVSPRPHFGLSRKAWFLGAVGVALAVPLLILPVPLDTDAQGFGYLALMIREGGTISTLAPWHTGIHYLYSPGSLLLFAAVSQLLPRTPMSTVMMGLSHAAMFLFIWLAWEFGTEIGIQGPSRPDPGGTSVEGPSRWSWAAGLSAALSVGLWTALLDSHYTAIFGLLFALGCLTSFFRYRRTGLWPDAARAGLCLAAVAVTHPDMTVSVALGLLAFLTLGWFAIDRPGPKVWLVMALAIPLGSGIALAPWLAHLRPLVGSGVRSPFPVDISFWRVLTVYHGGIWPILAIVGAAIYLRRRPLWALTMAGWLVLIVDVSTVGGLERVFPRLSSGAFRFNFPFSLAWHAPILPYLTLGAGALVWAGDRLDLRPLARRVPALAIASSAVWTLVLPLHRQLLTWSKGRLGFQGAFATENDVAAMQWLRDHTSPEARVLNYPGDYPNLRDWEAAWAPVISERDCVYFRSQPFFVSGGGQLDGLDETHTEQQSLLAFWRDPADPEQAAALRAAGIRYVLVPESIGDPASFLDALRWRPPSELAGVRSQPDDAPYLTLAFRRGGAQVYQVAP